MEIDFDFQEVVALRRAIKKIAEDGIIKDSTHKTQVKKFWRLEGRRVVALAVKDPLNQSDGTMHPTMSHLELRELLRKKGQYSIVPYPKGTGVRVGPGNIKPGPVSMKRYDAFNAMYPERAIAPGGSSKPQRKWMVPARDRVAKGTIVRFRDLMDAALIARMDVEVANRKARYAKKFADIEADRLRRKEFGATMGFMTKESNRMGVSVADAFPAFFAQHKLKGFGGKTW